MHVILWEFAARPGAEEEFELRYGPNGVWGDFFRQGQGYIGTELLRDPGEKGRYITVDRWTSREAFEDFRTSHLEEYKSIDRECEQLTESEILLGSFDSIESRDRK